MREGTPRRIFGLEPRVRRFAVEGPTPGACGPLVTDAGLGGGRLCSARAQRKAGTLRLRQNEATAQRTARDAIIAKGRRARRGSLSRFRRHSERSMFNLKEQHYWAETAQ